MVYAAFQDPKCASSFLKTKEQKPAPAPTRVTEIFKTINLSEIIIDFTVRGAAEALDSSHSLP